MLSTSSTAAATELHSPATPQRRPPGRPWATGQSGNPTGQRAKSVDPGELARRHVRSAIRALVRALASPDQQAAVAAARALLAEAHGQPVAHHAHHMPNLTMVIRAPTEHETARTNGEARAWDA